MFFSIVLDARPHLRYWNPSISSETSSNAYFDRLPCKFSRFWAPLQGNRTFSRQVQFYCSGAQNFETCLGTYRRPFRLSLPPHFRLFSTWWWPQIIDMSELKWPNIFDMTNIFWPKKKSFLWNHDFRENWLGSLSMAFFHGKSESGSKFQYIIFKYRCHDIG